LKLILSVSVCFSVKRKEVDMDSQVVSHHSTYQFIPTDSLEFQKPPEWPFDPPIVPSPSVYNKHSRRRAFDRILQRIKEAGLPGEEHVISYMTHKYRRNFKERTLSGNGATIRFFLTTLKTAGKGRLEDMSRQDIEAFVEHEQDRGMQIRSVKSRLASIYSFIRFLVDKEVLSADMLLKKIRLKMPDSLPRAIDSADLDILLSVIDNPRDRALFLLLLRTGMRIGELLALRVSDVNLREQKVMIYIGEKNYRGRVVYFSDDARDALNAWLTLRDPQKDFVFYGRTRHSLSYAAARKRFNKYLDKAGLSHKGYTMHQLRHTFATELLNAGMRIECLQTLLGHSDLEMTKRYARLSDKTRETEYFRAISKIERGTTNEDNRLDHKLQAVFEEKKLLASHG
jgi:integrase/recombinase XerD